MAGDRVQFNSLERAISGDINSLQDMQTRTRNDLLEFLSGIRGISNSGGADDGARGSTTLGLNLRTTGSSLTVRAGVLSQFSTTHPAAAGTLESEQRLGISRADVAVPLPGTPSVFSIIEARVIDVTTVSELRDVFDVPTQTFVPTLITKQVERRIEFQIVDGSASALPAFTGDPWVPLYGFQTDGSGDVNSLPTASFWDFRQNMRTGWSDDAVRDTFAAVHPDAQVESWAFHTQPQGSSVEIGGNFRARLGPYSAWLRSDDGIVPVADNVVTGAENAVENLYLAPLISNGITTWPIFQSGAFSGTSKGIFMRSVVVGSMAGPDNSATITHDAGGLYTNFDTITAHKAIHMGQVIVGEGGIGSQAYYAMTQDSGGRCFIRPDRALISPSPTTAVINFSASISPQEVINFDLDVGAPPGARTVIVSLFILNNSAGNNFTWELQRQGETWAFGLDLGQIGLGAGDSIQQQMELPVHETDGTMNGMEWQVVLNETVGASTSVSVQLDIIGWTF